jgi:hypothetical protein
MRQNLSLHIRAQIELTPPSQPNDGRKSMKSLKLVVAAVLALSGRAAPPFATHRGEGEAA